MNAPVGRAAPDVAPPRGDGARPRPAQGFGGLLDGAVAENAAPRANRTREKKPAAEAKGTEQPDAHAANGGAFAALAALAVTGAPAPGPTRLAEGSAATPTAPAPVTVATGGVAAEAAGEAEDDAESPPDAELPFGDAELASTAEAGSDAPDLAAHLDTLGVKLEVVGLSTAPAPPGGPAAGPLAAATAAVDTLPLPVETDAAPGDVAAAMDHRALSARDGITVRVSDGPNPWEIDVARDDTTLNVAVRADQAVRSIVATEEASIRAAAARDGYHLGRIELTERVGSAVLAVNATAESANTSQTGSNLSHEQSSADARREELPTWPLPRRVRAVTTTAAAPRAGRLDRDV